MSTTTSTFSNRPLDLPDNRGPLINVIAWFFIVVSFLIFFTRMATKWLVSRKSTIDDSLISISLLFGIAETAAINIAVANGLGQRPDVLSAQKLINLQKSYYAANILWLVSQCSSKLSVGFLIRMISPTTLNERVTRGVMISTFLWGMITLIVLLFQCQVPQVWRFFGGKCINRSIFWIFTNVIGIFLDGALIILPVLVVWNLHVSKRHKIVVVACFATRVFTMGSLIFQSIALTRAWSSNDPLFETWLVAVASSTSLNLGIITACVPYLKPFLDGLESGMIRSDDILRREGIYGVRASASGSSKQGKLTANHSTTSKNVIQTIATEPPLELRDIVSGNKLSSNLSEITGGKEASSPPEWETGSCSSRTEIIRQTKTWIVETTN
ncbi:hypothetical protein BGZ60DRAFT_528935 [Tricladium varicosporioides]|nr:hypothetical protein BGZ60DRAFT_528935 [Hymenoscyphus varicosporioides]